MDDDLAELAERIPGFAGIYYDADGELTATLVDMNEGEAARSQLEPFLAQQRMLNRGKGLGRRQAVGSDVRFKSARYDFTTLRTWYNDVGPAIRGVNSTAFTDIDEVANRLSFGVVDSADIQRVEQIVARAGIPPEAVSIVKTSRIGPLVDSIPLTGRRRGVEGGFQIESRMATDVYGGCTHSFNVHMPDNGDDPFFFTAAHCSAQMGTTEYTPFWQPVHDSVDGPNYIGVEVWDEHLFYGNYFGNFCDTLPVVKACRYGDATLGHYESPGTPAFGQLPYPHNWDNGTKQVYDCWPCRLFITDEGVWTWSGQFVHKMGMTTGATAGNVNGTCVDIPNLRQDGSGHNIWILCSSRVRGNHNNVWVAGPGDSGAPVYDVPEVYEAKLLGILFAGPLDSSVAVSNASYNEFYFSPMGFLHAEYGSFTTH